MCTCASTYSYSTVEHFNLALMTSTPKSWVDSYDSAYDSLTGLQASSEPITISPKPKRAHGFPAYWTLQNCIIIK